MKTLAIFSLLLLFAGPDGQTRTTVASSVVPECPSEADALAMEEEAERTQKLLRGSRGVALSSCAVVKLPSATDRVLKGGEAY